MKKLMGSGITSYFDGIIITAEYKFLLDLDYTNGKIQLNNKALKDQEKEKKNNSTDCQYPDYY